MSAVPPMDEFGYGTSVLQFSPGCNVELSPCTDRWMMGDKYGRVIASTKPREGRVAVRLEISKRTIHFLPGELRYRR